MTLAWSCSIHRSTSVQVANCLLLGSGWAVSCVQLLHRTFSAPGLTAADLHWNFLRSGPLIGHELRGTGGRGRQGKGRKGRMKQNSIQSESPGQKASQIDFLALDRFCARSFLYCLQNAHKDDVRDFFKVRFFYESLAWFSVAGCWPSDPPSIRRTLLTAASILSPFIPILVMPGHYASIRKAVAHITQKALEQIAVWRRGGFIPIS